MKAKASVVAAAVPAAGSRTNAKSKRVAKTQLPSDGYLQMRDIQRAFAKAIMRPLTKNYGMQSKWSDGRATKKVVAEFVKPNDRLTSFERTEIYNKQYWFRLLDNLHDDFPGLRALLGDARFHQLSIAYLDRYPSTSFTLRDLGQNMEKFLAKNPKWVAPHHKLARDIVRMEWAHIVAFDGDELPPLEIDELLDGANPATLRLQFQPYLTFLACDYPVDDFVIKVRRRDEPRGEASNAVSEKLPRAHAKKVTLSRPEKCCIAVHRHDHGVWYKRLAPEAYRICCALQKGSTLQEACARAMGRKKVDEDFGARLQGWFAQWASFGWFCKPGA
jgi:hypothetical protein